MQIECFALHTLGSLWTLQHDRQQMRRQTFACTGFGALHFVFVFGDWQIG